MAWIKDTLGNTIKDTKGNPIPDTLGGEATEDGVAGSRVVISYVSDFVVGGEIEAINPYKEILFNV